MLQPVRERDGGASHKRIVRQALTNVANCPEFTANRVVREYVTMYTGGSSWRIVGKGGKPPRMPCAFHLFWLEEVTSVFLGEYRHALDEKGRVTVPARLREGLTSGLFLTRGHDTNLLLFPQEAWEALAARLDLTPSASRERRIFTRWFFGGATEVFLDKLGRILVPAYLREYAEIDGEAIFVGADDVIELWNPQRWHQELNQNRDMLGDVLDDMARKGV
jgi:MraZ protein